MKSPGHIYLRFFAPFVGVLLLAMGAAWWIASGLMSSTLHRRLDEQMTHALEVLAGGVFPLTDDLLLTAGELLPAQLVLVSADGKVTHSGPPLPTPLHDAVLAQAVSGAGVTESDGFKLVLRHLPPGRDARFVAIAAVAELGDLKTAAQQTALLLALAAATAALVLAVAGHFLARGITRPIHELSAMANRIAAGDRDVRVQIEAPREIGALAQVLNDMAVKLGRYEKELKEQSRLSALGEMAARIAHEVRNPLTAIKLRLQLLADTPRADKPGIIARLLMEIDRLELIVSSALVVARPRNVELVPTDLNAVVDDVMALLEPQLAHQRIRVERERADLPPVPLDADRVKQILFNLVNNAVAAQPRGGRIRIESSSVAGSAGPGACLIVEDAGPGMADAAWDAVHGDSSNTQLGLGLRLSRELVALHGGTLHMDRSVELGGARFTVTFPVPIIDRP